MAGLYKHSHDLGAPEEVTQASSFEEAKSNASKLNKSSDKSMFCYSIPITGCGGNDWRIVRSMTAYQAVKNVLGYTNMLSVALLSILIFGMFTAFFAPTALVQTTGLISSCQTVMTTAVVQAL